MNEAVDTLFRSDSLRLAEQLFLQGAHFGSVALTDSLPNTAAQATAVDIYGHSSTLVSTACAPIFDQALTTSAAFQMLVLVMATAYILLIYHWASNIGALFMRTSFDKSSASLSEMRVGNNHRQLLNTMGVTGLLLFGLLSVKSIDLWLPAGTLPTGSGAGVSLLATAVLMALVAAQVGMLYLIGNVTFTRPFTSELIFIKRTMLTQSTIWIGPPLLLFVLCPPHIGEIWMYIIITEVIIITTTYLYKTFILFLSKKVSILLWFLYLCSIELFPVSLLWLLATR